MSQWINHAAALTGASGVLLGAYGAHGLGQTFPLADVSVWRTAVLYHLIHAVALLALALYQRTVAGSVDGIPHRSLSLVAGAFVLGVTLFSGSLYVLTMLSAGATEVSAAGSVLGPLTPVGGVVLVSGWLLLLRH